MTAPARRLPPRGPTASIRPAQDTREVTLPCRAGDRDLWFAETPEAIEDAKASCRRCPIRPTCLAGALARREPWGVWGGELVERGQVLVRKRPRGRPRKGWLAA